MLKKICFASNNQHKLEEIAHQLQGVYQVSTLKEIGCFDELPETGNTLAANSLQKAQYVFDNFAVDCFADDTGMEIEALNGEPGVDSAHYSGSRDAEANMKTVLEKMKGQKNRKACFKTVITLFQNGKMHQFTGQVDGYILESPEGDGGFGYDPIFVPEGYDRTFAEMSVDEKSKISHRGRAVVKLVEFLKK